jgi:hypothetical protein
MLLHEIINFVNATLSDVTDDLRYDDKWHEINPFLLFGENNTNVLNAYFKSPKKQEHLLLHCHIPEAIQEVSQGWPSKSSSR